MAEKTVKTCDVFGTTKDVKRYEVSVVEVNGDLATHVSTHEVDLGTKGLDRLEKFIERGVHPAGHQAAQQTEE